MILNWYDNISMSRITDSLFVGNYNDAHSLIRENPTGIQAVLNVSQEPPYLEHASVQYQHVPFPDGYEIPIRHFASCMAFLAYHRQLGHKTLVHCAAGISRSPCIVLAFLVWSGQMLFDAAELQVRQRRPIFTPSPAILRSVKQHLRVWPYQEDKQLATYVQQAHPDRNCPLRVALSQAGRVQPGQEMHALECTCGLSNP